jgi:ABC-2 type transport system permease protein
VTTTVPAHTDHAAEAEEAVPARALMLRSFGALLLRDVVVTGNELAEFLAQVLLQPVFFLFVFGKLLTDLGYTSLDYVSLLFPGLVALTAALTAIQTVAFPLIAEFGWTKEIEDRLLAPLPLWVVMAEKLLFATVRALIAAFMMFPLGLVILGSIPFPISGWGLLVVVLLLGSLLGACIGIVIGTFVPVTKISFAFALIFPSLLFTSATQYPLLALAQLRWFQVITAANPITYISEGTRAALVPQIPHISGPVCLLALTGFLVVFGTVATVGFRRRALS